MKVIKKIYYLFFASLIMFACSVDPEIKPVITKDEIKEIVPEGWPTPIYNFGNNPLTVDGFTLGRYLFYDPILSSDNTISCGSCHQQFSAFSNAGHDLSHGVSGLLGTRNTPALQNLNWLPTFMHDGGINHIEVMPLAPITNPLEMNETMANVIAKISASGKYKQLFTKAYGDDMVNSQRIFRAIAQFMGTMYSYNSKYDKVKAGEESFSAQEQAGYNLFVQKCSSCHKEPLFSDYDYRNNGLVAYIDSGRAHVTGNPSDKFKFKTPSLRNIEKTAPYMHDGRFYTLDQCLNHYVSGIVTSPTLDPLLVGGINMSTQDNNDIIVFLKTLTDTKFLTDSRYSEIH